MKHVVMVLSLMILALSINCNVMKNFKNSEPEIYSEVVGDWYLIIFKDQRNIIQKISFKVDNNPYAGQIYDNQISCLKIFNSSDLKIWDYDKKNKAINLYQRTSRGNPECLDKLVLIDKSEYKDLLAISPNLRKAKINNSTIIYAKNDIEAAKYYIKNIKKQKPFSSYDFRGITLGDNRSNVIQKVKSFSSIYEVRTNNDNNEIILKKKEHVDNTPELNLKFNRNNALYVIDIYVNAEYAKDVFKKLTQKYGEQQFVDTTYCNDRDKPHYEWISNNNIVIKMETEGCWGCTGYIISIFNKKIEEEQKSFDNNKRKKDSMNGF